jgi:hypothetical protein
LIQSNNKKGSIKAIFLVFLGSTFFTATLAAFYFWKIERIEAPGNGCLYSQNQTSGFYDCKGYYITFNLGELGRLKQGYSVFADLSMIIGVIALLLFSRISWNILDKRYPNRIHIQEFLRPLLIRYPFLEHNLGAPFIGAFIGFVIISALELIMGDIGTSNTLAYYSFILLTIAIILQILSA